MRYDRMTIKLQDAIARAQAFCELEQQQSLECEHLLLELLKDSESVVLAIIKKTGINSNKLRIEIELKQKQYPTVSGGAGQIYLSNSLKVLMNKAFEEASQLKDEFLSAEHFLLAVVESPKTGVSKTFQANGLNRKALLKAMTEIRGNQRVTDQNPEEKYQVLKKYCIDLTEQAQAEKLDPVVGRDEEIRRVIQVLSRRTKNNPVLIGEPGVGKTAIVEGLAQRIHHCDIPEGLKDKRILTLDLAALVAGTKYRGEFEDRLKSVIKEINSSDGDIMLFIDELHTLVGAGSVQGSMDASNMLKTRLSKG